MLGHEGGHALEPFALAVRHIEIHGAILAFFRIVGGTVVPSLDHRKSKFVSADAAQIRAGAMALSRCNMPSGAH
jgi:hypothetical protein